MDRTISLVVTVMDDGRVEFAWWRPEVDRYPSYRWYVSSVDECVWLMKAARTAIRELERRA
ncbi:hypothetical protein [Actinophytocola xinjiangensis]|nr:hypothetical protein [Actinophytocola xinjiangensis]